MDFFEELDNKIKFCSLCNLKQIPVNIIPVKNGENLKSKVMFVGLAPSVYNHTEFVFIEENYATNKILMTALESIGLKRNDVYVTNLVKCSTENNIMPLLTTIKNCKKYLLEEIKLVQPILIVTMGKDVSSEFSCDTGKFTKFLDYDVYSIPHPSYCARKPNEMNLFIKHFYIIQEFLNNHKLRTKSLNNFR